MSGQLRKKSAVCLPLALAVVLGAGAVTTGQTVPKARIPARPLIDLNKASAEVLAAGLPGVGEVTARKIVAGRPYTSVNDLGRAGVPPKTIEAIRPLVTVGPVPAAKVQTKAQPPTTKAAPVATKPAAPRPLVNINTASKAVLDSLPGIGPVKAQAIIDARPFKAKEDVMKVKGIKEGEFAKIKNLITVD